MTTIAIRDEAHWHELRAKTVGSSEVAALFDCSPWLSRWQLWQIKTGNLVPDNLDENERVREGKYFEPAIANLAAEKFGLKLRKVRRYIIADDCPGMGASLDYEEFGDGSLIPTEIKWSLIGDGWEWEGDEITDAPENYLLQVQHQLGCMPNAPHARLIAYAGGRLRHMIIERRDTLIAKIKEEIKGFWWSVSEAKEPPPDFSMDGDAIARVAATRKLMDLTLTGDEIADPAFREFLAARETRLAAEKIEDFKKAEVLKRILDVAATMGVQVESENVKAVIGDMKVNLSLSKETPPTVITAEMVGTSYGGRRGFRRFLVSEIKPPKKGK